MLKYFFHSPHDDGLSIFVFYVSSNKGGNGLNKAYFLILEIINRVIILKELSAQYPVFLALLAAKSRELPWHEKYKIRILLLVEHHVTFLRQFDGSFFALLILQQCYCERW
jgi:hypothetical protein